MSEEGAENQEIENKGLRSDLSKSTKELIKDLSEKDPNFNKRIEFWRTFAETLGMENTANILALMEYQAHQDTLTGLLSQTGFLHHAKEALSLRYEQIKNEVRVIEEGRKVFILYGDVDGLKKTNDELGREIGDVLLIQVSGAVENGAVPGDIISRAGSDEFAILCIDATAVEVEERYNNIMTGIKALQESRNIPEWSGVTFGIAVLPEGGDIQKVLYEADKKMKEAKNRFIVEPGQRGGHLEGLQDLSE